MVDFMTPAERSERMSRIRGKDTKPELLVRRFLHGQGFRYRLHAKELPGRPDLVLPKYKAVVFVDGCFWHVLFLFIGWHSDKRIGKFSERYRRKAFSANFNLRDAKLFRVIEQVPKHRNLGIVIPVRFALNYGEVSVLNVLAHQHIDVFQIVRFIGRAWNAKNDNVRFCIRLMVRQCDAKCAHHALRNKFLILSNSHNIGSPENQVEIPLNQTFPSRAPAREASLTATVCRIERIYSR